MITSSVTSATATNAGATATNAGNTGSALSGLSENYTMFLKLLTSQMTNQDPLKPMESTEFTQQLVQFSSVEQSIQQNSNLKKMLALLQGQNLSTLTSYLGKEITIDTPTASLGSQGISWNYNLGADASQLNLQVQDSSGRTIFEQTGPKEKGEHSFQWDGTDTHGRKLSSGDYTLVLKATASNGSTIQSKVSIRGVADSVNTVDGIEYLEINGINVDPSGITSVKNVS